MQAGSAPRQPAAEPTTEFVTERVVPSPTPDCRAASALPVMSRPWQALTGAKRFEAALRQRACGRSEHFSVHRAPPQPASADLSTSSAVMPTLHVDDSLPMVPLVRLGMVVPKRHAKRAATRNLIKRQIRAAVQRHLDRLPAADWVVRLRAPIDRKRFVSAQSDLLKVAMRAELEPLIAGLTVTGR